MSIKTEHFVLLEELCKMNMAKQKLSSSYLGFFFVSHLWVDLKRVLKMLMTTAQIRVRIMKRSVQSSLSRKASRMKLLKVTRIPTLGRRMGQDFQLDLMVHVVGPANN